MTHGGGGGNPAAPAPSGEGAALELDDDVVPVRPGVCALIPPGVRHRAVGSMRVLILVLPKFDPADEWFD